MLKITNQAILIGTDLRLIYKQAIDGADSKTSKGIDNILDEHKVLGDISKSKTLETNLKFCSFFMPITQRKDEAKMKKTKETSINNTLLNIISPMGLEIKRNNIILGENTGKVYGIVKYPQDLEYSWLSKITNIPGTICSINFTPIDSGIFIENISRSINRNRGVVNSARDPLTRSRAEKAAEGGERIMKKIDQQGEAIGQMGVTIMPISKDEELFEKACRKVESRVTSVNCRLRGLSNLQEEGFKQLSPFYSSEKEIENIINRIVPLSTFIGGFPFASSGYNDGTGYYFAKDSSGGLVIIDPWLREEDRTNTNFVIMGVPGVGKSTAIKHIVLSEYMKGTKLIFVDPHREYLELCKELNGDWINAGGGSKGKINPLQIRTAPRDDEDDMERLYDRQKAILKSEVIELYNNFDIFWDTDVSKLSNKDFPIILDLYNQILEKSKDKKNPYIKDYDDLSLFLKDLAGGR